MFWEELAEKTNGIYLNKEEGFLIGKNDIEVISYPKNCIKIYRKKFRNYWSFGNPNYEKIKLELLFSEKDLDTCKIIRNSWLKRMFTGKEYSYIGNQLFIQEILKSKSMQFFKTIPNLKIVVKSNYIIISGKIYGEMQMNLQVLVFEAKYFKEDVDKK
ncbi:hypothetical protein [Aureivirga marina]|uniref:hypothetical protein n=1 Tax=Aureivirga marina TaxID=1182451 RepID=UPI0018C94CB5|nr:hypothetical protein [Aureivirga marina]